MANTAGHKRAGGKRGLLSHGARRRWSMAVLVIGLPLYIVAAITLVGQFDRPPVLVELLLYVALGIVWALPLRFVFRGVGRTEAEADGEP